MRTGQRLKEAAQTDRDNFESAFGRSGNCSCHLNPPCGSCIHPGNPANQDEDDDCWEPDPDAEVSS